MRSKQHGKQLRREGAIKRIEASVLVHGEQLKSSKNDDEKRLGGTISASLFGMMQGVQILRVHDVNDVIQGTKVFNELIKD